LAILTVPVSIIFTVSVTDKLHVVSLAVGTATVPVAVALAVALPAFDSDARAWHLFVT
jgi:hypothetical protein